MKVRHAKIIIFYLFLVSVCQVVKVYIESWDSHTYYQLSGTYNGRPQWHNLNNALKFVHGNDGKYWCADERLGGRDWSGACLMYSAAESDDRWETPLEVPYTKWCQNCSEWNFKPNVRI